MATPQYGTLLVSGPGKTKPINTYFSDAAGAATYPDGASEISFGADVAITDLIFAATLATTPTLTFFVGGSEVAVLNTAGMTVGTIGRTLQQSPIRIPRGANLRIVQS